MRWPLSQRFNLIMVSLAATDLLCGFVIPFNTLRIGRSEYYTQLIQTTTFILSFPFLRWSLGRSMCTLITSSVVILLSCSIYNFVFINLDRLFAIKFPLTYRDRASRRNVKMGIALCWVLSLFPALPMWTNDSRTDENDGSGCVCDFPYDSVRQFVLF